MAFQISETKISGTIDGISFYESQFGWLVRQKGGPTRKQFKTTPAFARSRENSSEFAACPPLAAKIRRLIMEVTGQRDRNLYHRLMKLMCALVKEDTSSVRGLRQAMAGIQTVAGRQLVKAFEIPGGFSLERILCKAGHIEQCLVPKPEKEAVHEGLLHKKARSAERRLPCFTDRVAHFESVDLPKSRYFRYRRRRCY